MCLAVPAKVIEKKDMVATVEGFPELKDVMHRIEQKQYRKVALLPFMFVAGDHAKNDMAGDEDSWKCELEEAGYEVRRTYNKV